MHTLYTHAPIHRNLPLANGANEVSTHSWPPACQLERSNNDTVIREMFVVKIFSWGRRTTKIKRTNICAQYTLCVFNYCKLPQPQKYFNTKILYMKIFHPKFF